ncbi:mercuric reductase [Alkalinema pantanalense CENA528]|uniref:mercuric reductase n=1 Tax=Alkalinema pantanalense TaxID=1620705 RepID=UPI003D6F20D0
MTSPQLFPHDRYNQELLNQVHPADWQNPQPQSTYDLVVIGAGTAGLVVAAGAAGLGLGLRVALVERHLMGGDCLNFGCVPSKALIRAARSVFDVRESQEFGVHVPEGIEVDFSAVMERLRSIRSTISHHDSAARFRDLGIDVFLGNACFTSEHTISVENQALKFKKAVIATGTRAAQPEVPGLAEAGYLTNETVFSLTERPRRFAIVGGGPIGCELAQAFQRLGSQVILLHKNDHVLDREDPAAAEIVQNALIAEGVELHLGCKIQHVQQTETGKVLQLQSSEKLLELTVDEILVAAGRQPNLEGLNLEAVGVEYDARRGVRVNDYLQTTQSNIYAAGDICMDWKFTHAADAAARIVIKNMLFSPFGLGRSRLSQLVMPWVTYTDPEVAHVGLYEADAAQQGIATDSITIPFDRVDRAMTDSETTGFVKILHKKGSDQILGATIVARHAGEMINEITLAIVAGKGLNTLSTVIHPYPTQAEGIKKAADAYRKTLLTPSSQQLLKVLSKLS